MNPRAAKKIQVPVVCINFSGLIFPDYVDFDDVRKIQERFIFPDCVNFSEVRLQIQIFKIYIKFKPLVRKIL